jgi:hypothetical protein
MGGNRNLYCPSVLLLPVVLWKTVGLGQGDVQVFFRAGWALWTGYPLYEVTDHHGWTFYYPPTFALFMAPFANPLPDYPQPVWALPFAAAVAVWYVINAVGLFLALHVWANALERQVPVEAKGGSLQSPWTLRLGPLLALLPFVGDGLVRGQPAPVLLLLLVLYFGLYAEKRLVTAAFAFSLAIAFKVFPVVLAIFPLFRRDWTFLSWTAGWGLLLLVGLPVICLGPATTFDLYRAMLTDHLAGLASGSMSPGLASEVSPGGYSSIGVGAVVARIAAGRAFYSSPLPGWASAFQLLFNAALVAAIVGLGRGGFWNVRSPQPACGYPLLIACAVLLAAVPLMITPAGPQYVTFAVPLMAVFLIESWRCTGKHAVTVAMAVWTVIAWLSMIALETPWNWLKIIGPMTCALLLLGPASLALLVKASKNSRQRPLSAGNRP